MLGFLLSAAASGCKSKGTANGPDYGGEEGTKIAQMVGGLADETTNASKLNRYFAADVAVDARQTATYSKFSYSLKGKPSISGETATATVAFQNAQSGEDAGERDWSFVKEGDAWKIKSAPLP